MFGKETFIKAGFSWFDFTPDKLEYYGGINFMKAGINYANVVTTVSPNYAVEITQNPQISRGLEGVLNYRKKDLYGILNGIDTEVWDPATDTFIYRGYDIKTFWRGKPFCKKKFQLEMGLKQDKTVILAGCVSRLDWQKGIDLIADVMPEFFGKIQFVILGSGDKNISSRLKKISDENRENFVFVNDFNEELAHKIYASSDIFLMPSRFEPCGLSQMISSRYGSVALVNKIGGLKDTITYLPDDLLNSNGFSIDGATESNLKSILGHILSVYGSKEIWNDIIRNAMKTDFSWNNSVSQYLKLFISIANP
jgi:starch synthase